MMSEKPFFFSNNVSSPSWTRQAAAIWCAISKARKKIPKYRGGTMDKKHKNFLFVFLLNLMILTIFLSSTQPSFSQPLPDKRFPKEIAQSSLPKLLDFGRGTCIPCKKMAPILKELAEEYKGRVDIKIIEIQHEREMTEANKIRLIPTQVFYDSNHKEVSRHEGFMDKEAIKKVFDKMGVK